MYILFELTDTSMVFTTKDESGSDITVDTYYLDTYELDPADKLAPDSMVVRKINETKGTWPPQASYPKSRILFKNQMTIDAFQSSNEVLS